MKGSAYDQARAAGAQLERMGQSLKGRINVYACTPPLMPDSTMKGGCGYWIVTIDRDTGVTPMFVKCGNCGGMATSRMYRVGDGLKPTHEWFRPKSAAELPANYRGPASIEHIRKGGLLLRPVAGGDGKWLAPTPETTAFVEAEQAKMRELLQGESGR